MSMAFAIALVVIGAISGFDPVNISLGLALFLYVWLTRHTRYDIFSDRMVIYYGAPRQKSVPLGSIKESRAVSAPMSGPSVLITLQPRGVLVIQPKSPEEFVAALDKARGAAPARPANEKASSPKPDSEAQRRKTRSRPLRSKDKKQ